VFAACDISTDINFTVSSYAKKQINAFQQYFMGAWFRE
jgi:hypothetical protein